MKRTHHYLILLLLLSPAAISPTDKAARVEKAWKESREDDNAVAHYRLGLMFEKGYAHIKIDINRAIGYYRLAAEHNHAGALYKVGFYLEQGYLGWANALPYYERSAKLGHPEALYKMGRLHELGLGENAPEKTIDSRGEMIAFYSKAARKGHPGARKKVHELTGEVVKVQQLKKKTTGGRRRRVGTRKVDKSGE